MQRLFSSDFARLFHLRSTFLLCGIAVVLLAGFGMGAASIGPLIGWGLFTLNAFFLYETGFSVIQTRTKIRSEAIVLLSTVGRLFFLLVVLVFVNQMGLPALLAVCGGLMFGQMNLHWTAGRRRRERPCSST
jgi:uncharacterized protein YybS (DUF2232 family)